MLYGCGGLINSGPEARGAFTTLANLLDAPVTLTLMGLGPFRLQTAGSWAYEDRGEVILPQRLMAAVQQCLQGRNEWFA